ncbi:LysR family transcriptional regulator [Bradyrhizobium sp. B097]|uniref:LysR family transcriptional regulator n=1 Tax=Bradyrhizobium sp. B097 TaxID=3140244 RepID=UPI00318324F4
MINVRHLAVFRAVVKTGSVSAAARLLAVSQPAVTKTLQQIEWEIGVPLFRRMKGRLQPTPESALLIPKVSQVFSAIEDLERLAAEISGGNVGHVSVATVSTLGASIVASAIQKYRKRRPQAVINVRALATREVVEDVANNQVDIGVADGATMEGTLETEPLCRAFIGAVISKRHRLAKKSVIQMEDLAGEKIIAFSEHTITGMELRHRLDKLKPPTKVDISVNQSVIACTLINSGLGVGLIDPFTALSGIFPNLKVTKLEPEIENQPRLIFPPNRPASIAASEFIQIVRETFGEYVSQSPLLRSL